MLGDLLCLSGLNIVNTCSIVATTRDDLVPFLWTVMWKNLDAMTSAMRLTLFQQTDRTGPWCPYMAFPCVWPFCPTSYIRTYESHQSSEDKCERIKRKQLTLLSQLPTARKSATGQKEREEIASGGGSATSTSFSGEEETFAVVELAPKKAMVRFGQS